MSNKTIYTIIGIIVALILIMAGAFWYISNMKPVPAINTALTEEDKKRIVEEFSRKVGNGGVSATEKSMIVSQYNASNTLNQLSPEEKQKLVESFLQK